jgi:hypothetical protein
MKSKLSTLLALALFLLAVPALAGHLNIVLEADLDGNDEVRTGATNNAIVGDPNGEGEVFVFGIDGDPLTLCYVLEAEAIDELDMAPGGGRAAHIHEAPAGVNGGVVANLSFPQGGTAADCLTEGEPGAFPTGEAGIVQRILLNPADFYVNVHNSVYPGGAIRGQLSNAEEDD